VFETLKYTDYERRVLPPSSGRPDYGDRRDTHLRNVDLLQRYYTAVCIRTRRRENLKSHILQSPQPISLHCNILQSVQLKSTSLQPICLLIPSVLSSHFRLGLVSGCFPLLQVLKAYAFLSFSLINFSEHKSDDDSDKYYYNYY
jgi:hypothetical protein